MSAFRTCKNGNKHLRGWDWLIVAAITVLAPALIGGFVALFLPALGALEVLPQAAGKVLAYFAGQILAPVFTVFAVPLACLLGAWALRIGWAGWAVAVLVPVTFTAAVMLAYAQSNTGYAPWVYVEPTVFFCFSAALHGLVMWLGLRWLRPAALAARG